MCFSCVHIVTVKLFQVAKVFEPKDDSKSSNSIAVSEINLYFREELIVKRNLRMAERVVRLLQTHPNKSFFFAFGAGHFLGEDSVINLVKQAGYRIQTITPRKGRKK